jgi:hypothetical protein
MITSNLRQHGASPFLLDVMNGIVSRIAVNNFSFNLEILEHGSVVIPLLVLFCF